MASSFFFLCSLLLSFDKIVFHWNGTTDIYFCFSKNSGILTLFLAAWQPVYGFMPWGYEIAILEHFWHFRVVVSLECYDFKYFYLILRIHTHCPVSWDCRIRWLHLCWGVRPLPNECPGYETKQSDGEVPVMLGLWGMRSTPSLPLLPSPLWPGLVAPEKALSMG